MISVSAGSSMLYLKEKPDCNNLAGYTHRLFRINSVSVPKKAAPASSIQLQARNPMVCPVMRRKVLIKLALVTAFGALQL